jgi:hypothetical protein
LISIIAKNYIFKCKLSNNLNWKFWRYEFLQDFFKIIKYFHQFVISQFRSFSHLENFSVGIFFDCPVTQIFLKSLAKQLKQYYKHFIFDKKEYFFGNIFTNLLFHNLEVFPIWKIFLLVKKWLHSQDLYKQT